VSGIYIHIPFCHQACHYCDFHFSTSFKQKAKMVDSICRELFLQKDFFYPNSTIETIYLGGGTPSTLSEVELELITNHMSKNFNINKVQEYTIEINPEDVNDGNINIWKRSGINRFSLGLQSFDDNVLGYLNRKHTGKDGLAAINKIYDAGFDNISVDLIYGIPGLSLETWQTQLELLVALKIPHVSAYCLTIEPKTVFGNLLKKGKIKPIDEELAQEQYYLMHEFFETNKLEHYEISNFGKHEYYSRHNTSYWKGKQYLGIGPSAHSFDGERRLWNVSNNSNYIRSIENGSVPFEFEELNETQKINEYILTGLRTKWGIDLKKIKSEISNINYKKLEKKIEKFLAADLLKIENNIVALTLDGFWKADGIAGEFFIDEN
jgi:oxygen-independent coproporphyrinogen-3 oxidase